MAVVAAHGAADEGDVLGAASGGAEPTVAALDAVALEEAAGVAAARAAKLYCSCAFEGRVVQVVA
jgi:hypothetical protein